MECVCVCVCFGAGEQAKVVTLLPQAGCECVLLNGRGQNATVALLGIGMFEGKLGLSKTAVVLAQAGS